MTVILSIIGKIFAKHWKPIAGGAIVAAMIVSVWWYHSRLLHRINVAEMQRDVAIAQAQYATTKYGECMDHLDWCTGKTREFLRRIDEYMDELEALDNAPLPREIRTIVEKEIVSEVCEEAVDQAFDTAMRFYNEGT